MIETTTPQTFTGNFDLALVKQTLIALSLEYKLSYDDQTLAILIDSTISQATADTWRVDALVEAKAIATEAAEADFNDVSRDHLAALTMHDRLVSLSLASHIDDTAAKTAIENAHAVLTARLDEIDAAESVEDL